MPQDLIANIAEIRAWRGRLHRSTIEHEVQNLCREWMGAGNAEARSNRYYPVALVACMEAFFRSLIAELIDHGTPYADRSQELVRSLKFDYAAIRGIQGKRVSLGELIAFSLPFSAMAHIEGPMSTLLEQPFFSRLVTVGDHWEATVNRKPVAPIILNLDAVKRTTVRLFEVRHIVAHEVPSGEVFRRDEVSAFFSNTLLLLQASNWLMYELLTPGAPLQQQAMNAEAANRLREATDELQLRVQQIAEGLTGAWKEEFLAAQAAWEEYARRHAAYVSGHYRGGSLEPLERANVGLWLTQQRLEELSATVGEAAD
jgi:uncharacterized protein YecT (DUF1311 family)